MQGTVKSMVCACLLGHLLLGFCGCTLATPRFYARDMASGWLAGPFELKTGTVVRTACSSFLIAAPNRGELDVMAKLKIIKISIQARNATLPVFVEELMAAQRSAVGPERVVPIKVRDTDVWKQYNDWPRITYALNGAPLFDILSIVQLMATEVPFVYEVTGDGIVIWPRARDLTEEYMFLPPGSKRSANGKEADAQGHVRTSD